jgi:DNA polymerase III epsilon subunit-like protein
LIPAGNWGKNVRSVVATDVWDAMRFYLRSTKTQPSFMRTLGLPPPNPLEPIACSACGAQKENLELHEHWDYDDTARIQRLSALIPICSKCHNVIHMGRARQLKLGDKALAHLIEVNQLSEAQARQHIEDAFALWRERSQHTYSVALNLLSGFLPESHIHLGWLHTPKFWSGNRLDAIGWARDRLASTDAVIVDTETTGLISGPNKNERAEVIELAILSMNGKLLYSSRFRPKYKIPKRTTAIHGLTNDALADCPTFAHEHSKIMAILTGRLAISYNDRFDSGVISKTCALFKLAPPDTQWECAMRMYRAFIEESRFVKLIGAKHSAVADCRATLLLMHDMAEG